MKILSKKSDIVAGIDVGGPKKGFHAVAFKSGQYWKQFDSVDPVRIVDWCREIDSQVIAIDAPCCWRSTAKARQAERELAKAGISSFITPTREKAMSCSFYGWMLNGAVLYRNIKSYYPLYSGKSGGVPVCFETFPQAVACALAGEVVEQLQGRWFLRCLTIVGVDRKRKDPGTLLHPLYCGIEHLRGRSYILTFLGMTSTLPLSIRYEQEAYSQRQLHC
jgi:hypothetical protein